MSNPFEPQAQQPQAVPPAGNPFGQPQQQAPAAQPPASPFAQQAAPVQQASPTQQFAAQHGTPSYTIGGSFSQPGVATVGGGQGADLKAMYGRLVLVFPLKSEIVPRNPRYATPEQPNEQRMTATFVVLDGDNPIAYGGDPYAMPPKPHPKSDALPHVSKALWVSQSKLIEQCTAALTAVLQGAQPGADGTLVLGRLIKNGTEHNSPWILDGFTAADAERATYYLNGIKTGQFPHPLA